MNAVVPLPQRGWQAKLTLEFGHKQTKTVLTRREHQGPLVIQKPFYPEGMPCHVYLLHPPGGVVGGDQLHLEVSIDPNAHALITTPAAGKFYRSAGDTAYLRQDLSVAADGVLEWLPQETILFADSQVSMQTNITLDDSASFIGWEMLCLGRPASGEEYSLGQCRQRFAIWRGNKPLIIEHTRLHGSAPVLKEKWGLQGATVMGTLLVVNANSKLTEAIREQEIEVEDGLFTTSLINDVLVCRVLARQAEPVRKAFINAWEIIRPMILKRQACAPRIWFT